MVTGVGVQSEAQANGESFTFDIGPEPGTRAYKFAARPPPHALTPAAAAAAPSAHAPPQPHPALSDSWITAHAKVHEQVALPSTAPAPTSSPSSTPTNSAIPNVQAASSPRA